MKKTNPKDYSISGTSCSFPRCYLLNASPSSFPFTCKTDYEIHSEDSSFSKSYSNPPPKPRSGCKAVSDIKKHLSPSFEFSITIKRLVQLNLSPIDK